MSKESLGPDQLLPSVGATAVAAAGTWLWDCAYRAGRQLRGEESDAGRGAAGQGSHQSLYGGGAAMRWFPVALP